jgi:hypothetical protein
MSALIAHVDTKRCKLEDVLSVPTPPRTKTWGVIGHGDLVESLSNAVMDTKFDIISQEYSLSRDGGKMFGVWTLQKEGEEPSIDAHKMIGFRNSINKTLAVGVTAGRRVTVCDNLLFSGDFVTYQKHVGRLNQNYLQEEAYRAVESMEQKLVDFGKWHDELKFGRLTQADAETLMCKAVRKNVLPEGQMGKFWRLFFDKKNEDKPEVIYDDTLYGFHGAVTQIWSRNSLIGTGPRHRGLVHLMNLANKDLKTEGEITRASNVIIDLQPIEDE